MKITNILYVQDLPSSNNVTTQFFLVTISTKYFNLLFKILFFFKFKLNNDIRDKVIIKN